MGGADLGNSQSSVRRFTLRMEKMWFSACDYDEPDRFYPRVFNRLKVTKVTVSENFRVPAGRGMSEDRIAVEEKKKKK